MSRRTGDGFMDGVELIRIEPEKGSSALDTHQEIQRPLVTCKKCGHDIMNNKAMRLNRKYWPHEKSAYLIHCPNDCNGKLSLCREELVDYEPVKLIPVPTEKKQSKCRKFLKKALR